jgi:hypothetical protein
MNYYTTRPLQYAQRAHLDGPGNLARIATVPAIAA